MGENKTRHRIIPCSSSTRLEWLVTRRENTIPQDMHHGFSYSHKWQTETGLPRMTNCTVQLILIIFTIYWPKVGWNYISINLKLIGKNDHARIRVPPCPCCPIYINSIIIINYLIVWSLKFVHHIPTNRSHMCSTSLDNILIYVH